jgi:ferredoxin
MPPNTAYARPPIRIVFQGYFGTVIVVQGVSTIRRTLGALAMLRHQRWQRSVRLIWLARVGVCIAHCPQEAIDLVRDPAKGEPLEIQKLMAQL